MYYVFKCIHGLGNRLCNIMNMFYIHKVYPNRKIFLIWSENEHCNIPLKELFDFSDPSNNWIQAPAEYHKKLFPRFRSKELYASTSKHARTKWDNIEEWSKHPALVSISFHLYEFVSYEFCIQTFQRFLLQTAVQENVQSKIKTYGLGREIIHVRKGDLLTLLQCDNETIEQTICAKVNSLRQRYPNHSMIEYDQLIVNRTSNHVIDSLGDLMYFSKHCKLKAYSPYSWFSSWIYLLSPEFDANNPIFDPKYHDILEL